MSGRETVLGKIRKSIEVEGPDTERRAAVAARLGAAPTGVIPVRAQLPQPEQIELFSTMADKYGATVSRVGNYDKIPAEVSNYLREHNLPAAIRIGADQRLKQAGWASEKNLEIREGASDGGDLAGVSHALAGIAETGTLALLSGQDNPTTINFLPEHHIVVVNAADVTGDMEGVWSMLRAHSGKGEMPRAVNLVTGPSRSGDIEQTILLGAHGPRALHIIIVD